MKLWISDFLYTLGVIGVAAVAYAAIAMLLKAEANARPPSQNEETKP